VSTVRRSAVLDQRHAESGEVLLFPGRADHLYRLSSGLIRLYTVDDDGTGVTLRYVKQGGYFGEEALTGEPRRYFAEAVTPSVVEVIDPAALDEAELRRLAAVLAAALDGMGRALHRLAGKPLRARVAAELLELSDSDLSGRSPEGAPMVYITHDELATAVGSVRETVTKVVGELVRLGAIRAGYGKITVRDERVLREVAGE